MQIGPITTGGLNASSSLERALRSDSGVPLFPSSLASASQPSSSPIFSRIGTAIAAFFSWIAETVKKFCCCCCKKDERTKQIELFTQLLEFFKSSSSGEDFPAKWEKKFLELPQDIRNKILQQDLVQNQGLSPEEALGKINAEDPALKTSISYIVHLASFRTGDGRLFNALEDVPKLLQDILDDLRKTPKSEGN